MDVYPDEAARILKAIQAARASWQRPRNVPAEKSEGPAAANCASRKLSPGSLWALSGGAPYDLGLAVEGYQTSGFKENGKRT